MKVKVKTWNAMVVEFGVDDYDDIDTGYSFTTHMEELMPRDRIIEVELSPDGNLKWEADDYGWFLSEGMIEGMVMEVKIKTWDDMVEECGLITHGLFKCCIQTTYLFASQMEDELPEDRIIKVSVDGAGYIWEDSRMQWCISEDMIEERIKEKVDDS